MKLPRLLRPRQADAKHVFFEVLNNPPKKIGKEISEQNRDEL